MPYSYAVAAAFYLGGGLAMVLFWCAAGLAVVSQPAAGSTARCLAAIHVIGFVHPVAAWASQDLARLRTELVDPTRMDPDVSSRARLRVNASITVSSLLLAGVSGVMVVGG